MILYMFQFLINILLILLRIIDHSTSISENIMSSILKRFKIENKGIYIYLNRNEMIMEQYLEDYLFIARSITCMHATAALEEGKDMHAAAALGAACMRTYVIKVARQWKTAC